MRRQTVLLASGTAPERAGCLNIRVEAPQTRPKGAQLQGNKDQTMAALRDGSKLCMAWSRAKTGRTTGST